MRIIPHVAKSVESGLKKVASNDTDVYVLLLHYTPEFIKSGLTELWLKYDIEIKVRFVPLCLLITRLHQNICDVLTACDVTSKIKTKSAVLRSNPHVYLKHFGENKLQESSFAHVKMYLIKVL